MVTGLHYSNRMKDFLFQGYQVGGWWQERETSNQKDKITNYSVPTALKSLPVLSTVKLLFPLSTLQFFEVLLGWCNGLVRLQ